MQGDKIVYNFKNPGDNLWIPEKKGILHVEKCRKSFSVDKKLNGLNLKTSPMAVDLSTFWYYNTFWTIVE